MRLKFKFIPFLISLLIVVGITFGICYYSYTEYEGNKILALNKYFDIENAQTQDTQTQIGKVVSVQFDKYLKGSSKITFKNPTTFEDVSSTKNENEMYYDGTTFHYPGNETYKLGSFDVDIYINASDNAGEWAYNYYFYFYNIDYLKDSSFDPTNLQMIIVKGTGETESEEDEAKGLTLLNESVDKLFDDDTTNNPAFISSSVFSTYTYTGANGEKTYYNFYDNGFKNDDLREEGSNHYVFRMSPQNDNNHDKITDSELNTYGDATFVLLYNDGTTKQEIVRGEIEDITSLDKTNFTEGYKNSPAKLPEYTKYVTGKVALHGGIAFVLSGIVSFLFYLLWLDPVDTNKQNKKSK